MVLGYARLVNKAGRYPLPHAKTSTKYRPLWPSQANLK